ncbi:uncharacterized protein DUF4845 [Tamilnaduibacter salinus]|uniref:DUF4845 domain-containing protein n=1 Tax=Tamilnaduibacter salinus TaxID=1484056 RepID=A0A2A2I7C2_9GAMM|nr:DUF4845 domain-containing protein [Tamilnaduibacter salinus]PAV27184.1 DUF4845 domain-containing protein [Tamilnaduibacter salinus]PVY78982.1 uncharacterized protein DUF4845 [Tamilnaduibacter salinus]
MQKTPHTQRGASVFGMLVGLLLLGILVTFAVKLGPIYLDDITIQEAIESLEKADDLENLPPSEIRRMLQKRMSVNNIENIKADDVDIERDNGVLVVSVDYEERAGLFRNVDVVATFSHRYELTGR